LSICVKSADELPTYARQLVEHLRSGDQESGIRHREA
jgi:hypothetical protein